VYLEVTLRKEISSQRRGGTFRFLSGQFHFEKLFSFTWSVFMLGKALGRGHYQNWAYVAYCVMTCPRFHSLLVGTRDLRTLWSPPKVMGASKKRQNYQIYLVGFECVVKDIEAWLQLFTSFITNFGTIFLRKVATFFYGRSPLWLQTKNLRKIK
jgi:hypothetical protein